MAPLPTVRHQDISGNLYVLFREALKKAGCKCKVYMPIDYKVNDNTIVQPDLLITCRNISKQKFINEAPELVVEILSVSTAMKDLNSKFLIYQSQKIPYYLIIDPEKQKIEIHQYKEDNYQQVFSNNTGGYFFQISDTCFFQIGFDNIWE
jgi:Uma2 family endonuclease